MYAFYGFINELKINNLPKDENLRIDVGRTVEYCNNNDVKAIIFSNPCNPTSLGLSRQDIIRLVKNVFCLVIVDEAYMDFWGESVMDMTRELDNLIVLKTCSKNMGMAALRLGFAIAGDTITEALRAVKSPYNINAVTQAAAAAVLRHKPMIMEYTAEIVHSRKMLQNAVKELAERYSVIEKVFDSVTNFIFIRTPKAKEIYEKLLQKGISVRYMGSYLRVTAGTERENHIFINEFKDILSFL
jgi:histidinol-phosphate aminotransferase